LTNSGSGDSDSSQDSWLTGSIYSNHTVNLPVTKSYNRTKSIDISYGARARSNSLLQTMLSIGKRKKLVTVPITQNELIERLKKVITFAVDSAMFAGNMSYVFVVLYLIHDIYRNMLNISLNKHEY
jgi:hypothetical protein